MNQIETIIMGSAAFVVLGGATALKIILGLYLTERALQQQNFVNTVNAQIVSIKTSYSDASDKIEKFDRDVQSLKETVNREIPLLRAEMKETRAVSSLAVTFFTKGAAGEKSEVVQLADDTFLVRKPQVPG